ncbi:MAG: TetR/AcrR family transcriptional regulator [Bacteroidia bacterium]|nr:TetR/AcrR family transcriptional regulator [Bacteroidia bacterium]
MPRVKSFDKNEALNKAMILFWEKGYEATSLSDLTSFLGISKSSFYDTFEGKRKLFENCLDLYMSMRLEAFEKVFTEEKDIKAALMKILTAILDEMLSDEKRKGCLVANTSAELGGRDNFIRESLMGHHQAIHKKFSTYLKKLNWDYKIDRDSFIDLLMTFVMGMKQEVKFNHDRERFQNSITHLLNILK